MGLKTDDGLHDLYLAFVLADGSSGVSWEGDHVVITRAPGGRDLPAEQRCRHPLDEVVGYAVTCECMSTYGGTAQATVLAHWLRVEDLAQQDLDSGRVYVAPGQTAALSEREDVQAAMGRHWAAHRASAESRAQLKAAWRRHKQALVEVDEAVRAARAAGASWVEIGDMTWMTRQSARERWSKL